MRAMLKEHYLALKQIPYIAESKWVFIPENMTGHEHSHMEAFSLSLDPAIEVFYEKPNKAGVCKNDKITADYVFHFHDMLCNDFLHISQDAFTTVHTKGIESMIALLEEQAMHLRWDVRKAATPHQKDSAKLTAKMGATHQDDLLIATEMLVYWPRIYRQRGLMDWCETTK